MTHKTYPGGVVVSTPRSGCRAGSCRACAQKAAARGRPLRRASRSRATPASGVPDLPTCVIGSEAALAVGAAVGAGRGAAVLTGVVEVCGQEGPRAFAGDFRQVDPRYLTVLGGPPPACPPPAFGAAHGAPGARAWVVGCGRIRSATFCADGGASLSRHGVCRTPARMRLRGRRVRRSHRERRSRVRLPSSCRYASIRRPAAADRLPPTGR